MITANEYIKFLESVVEFTLSVSDIDPNAIREIVVEHTNEASGLIVMTTAQKLMAQGKAKGKISGEISLLQRQIGWKFPDASPVNLEGLSQEQLETIGERILTCNTLDEVLDGIA